MQLSFRLRSEVPCRESFTEVKNIWRRALDQRGASTNGLMLSVRLQKSVQLQKSVRLQVCATLAAVRRSSQTPTRYYPASILNNFCSRPPKFVKLKDFVILDHV